MPVVGPFKHGDVFLSKYTINGVLGHGGQAVVYEARDSFLNRDVAIKVIPNESGREIGHRAQQEAQLLISMRHPNIVEVYDAGATGEFVYIVMELIRGRSLRQALQDYGRFSVLEALTIMVQTTAALYSAHARGVIHRDLKPENLMIVAQNQTKVLDFGVAKVLEEEGKTTQKDVLLGTLLYISPEYLQGFGVTAQSDIFALGVMFFEMLTGHHYTWYKSKITTPQQLGWLQITWTPPLLHVLDASIPRELSRLIHKALAKNAMQRFRDAGEMHHVARGILDATLRNGKTDNQQPVVRDLSIPRTHAESRTLRMDEPWNGAGRHPGALGALLVPRAAGLAANPSPSGVSVSTKKPAATQGPARSVARVETDTGEPVSLYLKPIGRRSLFRRLSSTQVVLLAMGIGLPLGGAGGLVGLHLARGPARSTENASSATAAPPATVENGSRVPPPPLPRPGPAARTSSPVAPPGLAIAASSSSVTAVATAPAPTAAPRSAPQPTAPPARDPPKRTSSPTAARTASELDERLRWFEEDMKKRSQPAASTKRSAAADPDAPIFGEPSPKRPVRTQP